DNFNFLDKVQAAAKGKKNIIRNLTTCLLFSTPDVPGPFRRNQYRPGVKFKYKWILSYLVPRPSFLPDTVSSVVTSGFKGFFLAADDSTPSPFYLVKFPTVTRYITNKTYILQTPSISENEGEISGVYRLYDSLFRIYLSITDDKFDLDRLFLVYGDCLITTLN
ncbi:hypothetical protein QBC39DRAFT_260810, partial [Podospora conica]